MKPKPNGSAATHPKKAIVSNPRYQGATPELLAKALLRPLRKPTPVDKKST